MNFTRYTFLLIMFLFSLNAFGQNKSIEVNVSQDSILIGNTIKVEFVTHNTQGEFVIPSFENCIVSGPNISSQYQSINGQVSQKKSYTFYLEPTKVGIIYIPAIQINDQHESLESKEIKIIVEENPNGIIQDKPLDNGIFQEWSFRSNQSEKKETEKTINKNKRKRRKI